MPLGLGMMIYGLIVLFNGDVAQAFEMGAQGYSPEEIVAEFQPDSRSRGGRRRRRRDEEDEDEEDRFDDRDEPPRQDRFR